MSRPTLHLSPSASSSLSSSLTHAHDGCCCYEPLPSRTATGPRREAAPGCRASSLVLLLVPHLTPGPPRAASHADRCLTYPRTASSQQPEARKHRRLRQRPVPPVGQPHLPQGRLPKLQPRPLDPRPERLPRQARVGPVHQRLGPTAHVRVVRERRRTPHPRRIWPPGPPPRALPR